MNKLDEERKGALIRCIYYHCVRYEQLKYSVKLDFVNKTWDLDIHRRTKDSTKWYPSRMYSRDNETLLKVESNLTELFNKWWP